MTAIDPRDITVCIPTIEPRGELLARAIASVGAQTVKPGGIAVAYDFDHKGHGLTRNDAISMAQTEWLAFLDDDDEMFPQHIERLIHGQEYSGADVVYPWYEVIGGGTDPMAVWRFVPWNLDVHPRHNWAITCLVRKQVLLDVGGFCGYTDFGPGDEYEGVNPWSGQDWATWNKVISAGASIYHLPEVTWGWHHDSGNTSGQGDRW